MEPGSIAELNALHDVLGARDRNVPVFDIPGRPHDLLGGVHMEDIDSIASALRPGRRVVAMNDILDDDSDGEGYLQSRLPPRVRQRLDQNRGRGRGSGGGTGGAGGSSVSAINRD